MEGSSIGLGGGCEPHWRALGKAAPATYLISGGMACRMPASWRGDCPHEREVRSCSQRASEAAVWADKTLLSSMNRAAERGARDEAAGTQWPRDSRVSGKRPWGGFADNMLLCADRKALIHAIPPLKSPMVAGAAG